MKIKKGRERLERGILKNFSDLPTDKQNDFFKIKEFIDTLYGYDTEINIFGSYYYGDWDDISDYDIILKNKVEGLNRENIFDFLGKKVDIFFCKKETIKIPKK